VERLNDLNEATLRVPRALKERTDILLQGRILLAEDGADNQRLLRMQLAGAGASVTSALNGQIALDLVATQTFDLILMDMQMPVMDGYAATAELRRRGVTTPIIALTADAMAEDRDKCRASGCDGYLSKPVEEEELLKTAHNYLELRCSPGESIAGAPRPAEDRGDSYIGDSSRIIAPNSIKSSQAGNPRIMEIVPEFVAGLPAQVQKMIDLLASNDLPGLSNVAHQLRGACGGYGFAPISGPARTVEQSIKDGQVESITAQVESLIELIRRIDGYDESKEAVSGRQHGLTV
jgi:CheY-like chemotaxis protein